MKTPVIHRGRKVEPFLGILHGPHGIGKTCFGMKMPNVVYVTGEEIDEYDMARMDKCETWEDFLDQLTYLRDGQHDFKSVVIDTLDSIESLLHRKIVHEDGASSMAVACGGYGKAYEKAMNMMYDVRDEYLAPMRAKGMNILILAHSSKNKVEDPLTQSSYDKYELKLHKNSKGIGAYSVFSEWVSCILFCNFEVYRTDDKKYAVGEGRRLLYTEPRPAFDAKNRFGLPYQMNLDWDEVSAGIKAYYGVSNQPTKPEQPATEERDHSQDVSHTGGPEVVSERMSADDQKAEVARSNIKELLVRIQNNNLVKSVTDQVKAAGNDLAKLETIQSKLLKAV